MLNSVWFVGVAQHEDVALRLRDHLGGSLLGLLGMDVLAQGSPGAAMVGSDVHAVDVESQGGRQVFEKGSRVGGELCSVDLNGSGGSGVEAEVSGGFLQGGGVIDGGCVVVVPLDAFEAVVSEGVDALVGAGAVAHWVPGADGLLPLGCVV